MRFQMFPRVVREISIHMPSFVVVRFVQQNIHLSRLSTAKANIAFYPLFTTPPPPYRHRWASFGRGKESILDAKAMSSGGTES